MAWQDQDDESCPIRPLYIRCPRRRVRVAGFPVATGTDRLSENPETGIGATARVGGPTRMSASIRRGGRARERVAARSRRRSFAGVPLARGPDRPGCRVCRAPRQSGSAGDSVAVGPCMVRQAVVVCFPEDATCGGAGRAETRSPANRGTGRPRRDGWRYVSVVLLGGRFVDAAGIFDHRITNRRCGHRADRVLHLLKDG